MTNLGRHFAKKFPLWMETFVTTCINKQRFWLPIECNSTFSPCSSLFTEREELFISSADACLHGVILDVWCSWSSTQLVCGLRMEVHLFREINGYSSHDFIKVPLKSGKCWSLIQHWWIALPWLSPCRQNWCFTTGTPVSTVRFKTCSLLSLIHRNLLFLAL